MSMRSTNDRSPPPPLRAPVTVCSAPLGTWGTCSEGRGSATPNRTSGTALTRCRWPSSQRARPTDPTPWSAHTREACSAGRHEEKRCSPHQERFGLEAPIDRPKLARHGLRFAFLFYFVLACLYVRQSITDHNTDPGSGILLFLNL